MRTAPGDSPRSSTRRRSGCWTCKERRVKCNEGKPRCIACERLSLACHYGIKLLWHDDALSRGIALGRAGTRIRKQQRPEKILPLDPSKGSSSLRSVPTIQDKERRAARIREWMFLNTTYRDFRPHANAITLREAGESSIDDDLLFVDGVFLCSPGRSPTLILGETSSHSPFGLGANELYLLDYFMNGVIPRCTTWQAENPYTRNIVPICLSATNEPLFHIVMAISCHQLLLLEDYRFERDIWLYRAKALRTFQKELSQFENQRQAHSGWEKTIAMLIMLTFFDVSQDQSPTWLMHHRCARSIRGLLPISGSLTASQIDLYRFFCSYFAEHEAFARTASDIIVPYVPVRDVAWFPHGLGLEMTVVDALLGCSPELISLIVETSDIADVARHKSRGSINACRYDLEKRLYSVQQRLPPVLSSNNEATRELGDIAETRRLSALIYYYSRVDGTPPGIAPIDKLTRDILALIPCISLRSHALLWPLFVVGTMGIGVINAERGDADRALVLERLVSLQRTRYLKNVAWAKDIVERVWRMRDLRGPDVVAGWRDIPKVGRLGVSLC